MHTRSFVNPFPQGDEKSPRTPRAGFFTRLSRRMKKALLLAWVLLAASFSAAAETATTTHAQGRINETSVFVKYETGKRFETSLSFTCARGTLANYASYNLPNTATGKPDCTYRLLAKYYLK